MESVENKIIYLKVCEKFRRRSAFWKEILLPVFPVETKEFRWLGYDIMAYIIYADVQAGVSDRGSRCNLRKRLTEKRFRRTLGMISDRIRESGWEEVLLPVSGMGSSLTNRIGAGRAESILSELIARGGTEPVFPEEMVYRFFAETTRAHCKSEGVAEQLILIAPDTEEESSLKYLEETLLLSYRLYPEYNYMTILTDQPALFKPVMEEAAEESGLYIRCMAKEKNVLFPDKRTVILDLDRELAPCYRHFPGEALYVTPWNSVEKKRRLQAKCPQIACFSMLNALDTVLHNTV